MWRKIDGRRYVFIHTRDYNNKGIKCALNMVGFYFRLQKWQSVSLGLAFVKCEVYGRWCLKNIADLLEKLWDENAVCIGKSVDKRVDALIFQGQAIYIIFRKKGWETSRLHTVQVAVLRVKFDSFVVHEFDDVNDVAYFYTEQLENIVKVPKVPKGYFSSWAQYSVLLKSEEVRNGLRLYLQENGVPLWFSSQN